MNSPCNTCKTLFACRQPCQAWLDYLETIKQEGA